MIRKQVDTKRRITLIAVGQHGSIGAVAALLLLLAGCSRDENRRVIYYKDPDNHYRDTDKVKQELVSDPQTGFDRIRRYYQNGDPQMEGEFDGVKRVGTFTYWHPGKIQWYVVSYADDIVDGEVRQWSERGVPILMETYSMGGLQGPAIYYNSSGSIQSRGKYSDKEPDGFWQYFHPGEVLQAEGMYSKGKRVGEWHFFHSNGAKAQTGKFNVQGAPIGRWTRWYDNGQIDDEVFYDRTGKLDGPFKDWSRDGMLLAEGTYKNGLYEGELVIYLADGSTIRTTYKDGKVAGPRVRRDKNGTIVTVEEFDLPTQPKINSPTPGRTRSPLPLDIQSQR